MSVETLLERIEGARSQISDSLPDPDDVAAVVRSLVTVNSNGSLRFKGGRAAPKASPVKGVNDLQKRMAQVTAQVMRWELGRTWEPPMWYGTALLGSDLYDRCETLAVMLVVIGYPNRRYSQSAHWGRLLGVTS